jgi:hypothetical protein
MARPTNSSNKSLSCNPVSSECVIYNNQNLDCFEICVGDSVGDVIFGLGTILCEFTQKEYTLCLNPAHTVNLEDALELIAEAVCELQNATPPEPTPTFTCTDVKTCAWDATVITEEGESLEDVIAAIANNSAGSATVIEDEINPTLANHEDRITELEDAPAPIFVEPEIIPVCVLPAVATPISEVLSALEEDFCSMQQLLGSNNEIVTAISRQCLNLNTDTSLSTNGTMSAIPGWETSPNNLSESINNLWLTLCDMRAAIKDIKLNCCNTECSDFVWAISSTVDASGTQIEFYFDSVVIPSGFTACDPLGATFTISDSLGNSMNVKIPIQSYAGTLTPYVILIGSTPLAPASNYNVSVNSCFVNAAKGITCEKSLCLGIQNPAVCPEVVYTAGVDNIGYSFTGSAGMTYVISVYITGSPSVLVTSVTHSNVAGGTITGSITGLSSEVSYDLIMNIVNVSAGINTNCPTVVVETLPGT